MSNEPDHFENTSVDAERELSPATRRAYAADVRAFSSWCARRGLPAVPAAIDAVGQFLAEMVDQGRSWSSVRRAGYAIVDAYRERGDHAVDSARVAAVLRGLRGRVDRLAERSLADQVRDEELRDVLDYLAWFLGRASIGEARAALGVLGRALEEREHRG